MAESRRMTKSELFTHFAERFGIKRAEAGEFFDELQQLTEQELLRCGEFVPPGVAKLVVQQRERPMGRKPGDRGEGRDPGQVKWSRRGSRSSSKTWSKRSRRDAPTPSSRSGGPRGRTGRRRRAHSRFPGHALTPTGVMAIRCKQFHLPDL